MIKKCFFYTTLALIITFLSSGFQTSDTYSQDWFLSTTTEQKHYQVPHQHQVNRTTLTIPYTGMSFIGFKEALAFKESQGRYRKINSLGYMGKYQFGASTLKTIGVTNCSKFLNSPRLQEKAFLALLSKNKFALSDEIEEYEGHKVSGIEVTESGILAAAHLGGVGSVKKFFKNNGKLNLKDSNGASIRSYMLEFGGYETARIIADDTATVHYF